MVDALLVRLPAAFGEDPRPGERHAVAANSQVLQQLMVFAIPVIAIVGDIAGVAVERPSRRMRENIPIGWTAAVLTHGALDLIGRRGAAPAEVLGEREVCRLD